MAIQKGDSLPSIEALQESKPGNGVDIAKEIGNGDAVVIGVPAAFSMPPLPISIVVPFT